MNENETRKTNYAAIDIGSNAVRLLIKEIKEEQGNAHFSKVLMLRVPLRLGFDVFDIGKISEKKEKNMIRLMKAFRLQKKMANIHPLITIFGVVAGLPIFGFMGIIFGPLLVSLFLLFLDMFRKEYLLDGTEEEEKA